MTITESVRTRILAAMKRKGITNAELAQALGYTKPWTTRLLNGTLQTLSDETVVRMENLLEIQFFRFVRSEEEVSGLGIEVSQASKDSPELIRTIETILELHRNAGSSASTPADSESAQIVAIWEEITQFAMENEDDPSKIGEKVLESIRATEGQSGNY